MRNMKGSVSSLVFLFISLAAPTPAATAAAAAAAEDLQQVRSTFNRWLTTHSKSYSTDAEYTHRLSIFASNLVTVERHNAAYEEGYTTYAMSADGPFSDLSDEEFEDLYLMEGQNCSATHVSSGPVPSSYDESGSAVG